MPGFTPGRRYQPPFMPFKRQPFKKRVLAKIEIAIKGPLASHSSRERSQK